jgi:hypothetical protein
VQSNTALSVVLMKVKSSWRDGTTHLVMSTLQLIRRLAALVLRPRQQLIRFHGLLAPEGEPHARGSAGLPRATGTTRKRNSRLPNSYSRLRPVSRLQ